MVKIIFMLFMYMKGVCMTENVCGCWCVSILTFNNVD